MTGPWLAVAAAFALVALNGFFVATEFALVKVFVQHPRQPLAREKLTLLARGRDHDVFDRAIDVQVSRLRKLTEPDPSNPRYIQTVWGFGYVFVPDDETAALAPESPPT